MLTDKDMEKLKKVFVTKKELQTIVKSAIKGETVPLRQDIGDLKEEFKSVEEIARQTLHAVEGIVSRMDQEDLTNAARDAQLTRHDGWIHKIAKKTAVSLKD